MNNFRIGKTFLYFFLYISPFLLFSQTICPPSDTSKTALILIQTPLGVIKIRLFNETPKHRDNFLKLLDSGFYDSLLFHRIIEGFMIQGGDPDSKHAAPGKTLGDGEVPGGQWIDSEFNPCLFHKRGVLAAARESDDKNPERKSSTCQFYITQGKGPLNDNDLRLYEHRINKKIRTHLRDSLLSLPQNKSLSDDRDRFRKSRMNDSLVRLDRLMDSLITPIYENTPHYTFSESQKKQYKLEGGTPHLDGNYTVFGEVIYGMKVVDKIAAAPRDNNDRPAQDIWMKMFVLRRPK